MREGGKGYLSLLGSGYGSEIAKKKKEGWRSRNRIGQVKKKN